MDFWEYNLTSYSTRMIRFLAGSASPWAAEC